MYKRQHLGKKYILHITSKKLNAHIPTLLQSAQSFDNSSQEIKSLYSKQAEYPVSRSSSCSLPGPMHHLLTFNFVSISAIVMYLTRIATAFAALIPATVAAASVFCWSPFTDVAMCHQGNTEYTVNSWLCQDLCACASDGGISCPAYGACDGGTMAHECQRLGQCRC